MFKTFSGIASASPTTTTLTGNVPTVGWAVINDGTNNLVFKLSGYTSEPFTIAPGETMKIPMPISTATVEGSGGTTTYRAVSFGLASLYQEYVRELPNKVSAVPNGSVTSLKFPNSAGGQATDDATPEVNAPLVAVHVDITAAGDKFWTADRKYRIIGIQVFKTDSAGSTGDTLNILKAPSTGGTYTSILATTLAVNVAVNTLLAPTFVQSSAEVTASQCLKFTAVQGGGNCQCRVYMLLLPVA